MTVISMTREMGTRGSEVALGLADRLGLDIVHHEVVEHDIAGQTGLPDSQVHRLLEGEASLWERWKLDERRMSRYTALEILELAAKGNVLIRGWGGSYLLRSVPHVLAVRICAPISYRQQVLKERIGIEDADTARLEIERNDAAHNGAMQRLFGIDWRDASLFPIILNSARVSVKDCVEIIAELAQRPAFTETPESRRALMDELIHARVRSALEREVGPSSLRYGFEIEVSNGHVALSGATPDGQLIADTVRTIQGVEGVTGVESKVSHIAFVPHGA
ncbi:MAG: cytidylate kinase family protein [Alphaproteobacteria bacterium]|nr:cytidylate kinase family protein [Alphaproteobacteria bacterium]